ncbi:hypothetical protein ABFS82_04G154500 [Erythranthe guttata]|uniref:Two-component response regulator-like APRR1 n=1 Tax=Erythranthe guttata TaxID=4155 RepID=A0A022PZG3_ERYGU|nr:PREDICTED: two-component response regulator-like APRR1 [Erythranthe guttata]EYU21181.1 hypothetical protein MIMGU_mgv1a005880mg [Erythranthe guttata]|eukprot:XP_012856934.1 PREDICTED: two-component response regulator-like APRR1 [Erythranthe guttata]
MERSGGEGFIDRSKVRILLCENDEKSSGEISTLLSQCSYQVTSVKSPRQVIEALNAQGPDIDIILSEVDLPVSKGLKMLKYIMRDKGLRRVPVIMMSAQDEVPIVVKCLKFGAADYLVKPLRTNELLNLWTHVWRRRRMLGLVEKKIVSYDFDVVGSGHSDANTSSTTLFSDDTDDKSGTSINPETHISTHQENETNSTIAAPIATAIGVRSECRPEVPSISDRRTGQMPSFPNKSELKIGESSAFFTYVKSSTVESTNQGSSSSIHENTPQHLTIMENPSIQIPDSRETRDNHSLAATDNNPESFPIERNSNEEFYPYYISAFMNQAMMSSFSMYHNNQPDVHNYNQIPQCPPQIPVMASYPYYPFGMYPQPGQMPAPNPWPSSENCSSNEVKLTSVDRRVAALIKFRQKRKERCFDKKIRYVNRKKLAERRPRVKGQFVRKVNGVSVDLNGQPASAENDEEEYD